MSNDLFCGSGAQQSGVIIALTKIGSNIGTMLAGLLPNKFGRRRCAQFFICMHTLVLAALIFTEQLVDYGIVLTLCELCSTFVWTTYSAYGVEVIGPKWRVYFGSLVGLAHSLGFITVSVFAMYFPDRQLLTAVIAGLYALNLLYVPFIPESPIWALTTNRFDQARTSIASLSTVVSDKYQSQVDNYIRRMSNASVRRASAASQSDDDDALDQLRSRFEKNEKRSKCLQRFGQTTLGKMVQGRLIRKFTLLSVFMYAFTMMAYFGTAYYATRLPGTY